jgi:hypothetical protein
LIVRTEIEGARIMAVQRRKRATTRQGTRTSSRGEVEATNAGSGQPVVADSTSREERVVRLTVNLSEDAYRTLQNIAEKMNVSVTEALHRAIATQAFFLENEGKVVLKSGGLGFSSRPLTIES